MLFDLRQCNQWSDGQAWRGFANLIEAIDITYVHQARWSSNAVLHQVKQIDAAGLEGRARDYGCQCLIYAGSVHPFEAIHAPTPLLWLSAASTAEGFIGNSRMRMPVAL